MVRIGGGRQTKFWEDCWLLRGPLQSCAGVEILDSERHLRVGDVIDENGTWILNQIQSTIPSNILFEIHGTPVAMDNNIEDKLIWKLTPSGIFSVKSAYSLLALPELHGQGDWRWIWKCLAPEKVKLLLWLACKGRMHTQKLRHDRQINPSNTCLLCLNCCEDELHLLRDCEWASEVWDHFITDSVRSDFYTLDLCAWFKKNLTGKIAVDWQLTFIACLWNIWTRRNAAIIGNEVITKERVVSSIFSMLSDLRAVFPCHTTPENRVSKDVGWEKPRIGWMKLNVDGSVLQNPVRSSFGGILRGEDGEWVAGFSGKLGAATITLAELIALREGLKLAATLSVVKLQIESDSQTAVQLVKGGDVELHPYGQVVSDCRSLMHSFERVELLHIHREANNAADFLAKCGHNISVSYFAWNDPPSGMDHILFGDKVGVVYSRLVPG